MIFGSIIVIDSRPTSHYHMPRIVCANCYKPIEMDGLGNLVHSLNGRFRWCDMTNDQNSDVAVTGDTFVNA